MWVLFRYVDGLFLKEIAGCSDYNNIECDVDTDKILLENVTPDFTGNFSCEGMNAAGWGPTSDEEELIVNGIFFFFISQILELKSLLLKPKQGSFLKSPQSRTTLLKLPQNL